MKTYTFYVQSQDCTVTVAASHKQDALAVVVHQLNIKASQADKAIVCLGINLPQNKEQSCVR